MADSRARRGISKATQVAVFERDRWLCAWCRRPVVFAPAMRLLLMEAEKVASGPLSYHHNHWTRADAPLLDELGAVIDHVEAYASGGGDDPENLATCCNKCNGRKSARQVEEFRKRLSAHRIKGKYGEPEHWDGLASIFVALAENDPSALTSSEKEWLRALSASTRYGVAFVGS